MTRIFRQGDVVLEEVKKPPEGLKYASEGLSMTGETGNAHVLAGKVYQRLAETYIEVGQGGAVMVHPEHPMLSIPRGLFLVRRLRSYAPEGNRLAID